MNIIGTRIKEGQGLGNRLFVYISLRAIAQKKGFDFAILSSEILDRGLRDAKGIPFLTLDYGKNVSEETWISNYHETSDRLFIGNSKHDIINGVDVSGFDSEIWSIPSGSLVEGILQAPEYFDEYADDVKEWLAVNPEFDSYEYSEDDMCIINIRGREYADSPELFLRRKYWLDAMNNMRRVNANMRFMVVTDDVNAARRILPEVEAYHFEVWKDYVTIKNAKYLILSNSSFAFFPAYTSTTAKQIIAPKYWARHNTSNGYWSCEQNIYDRFMYQDRKGKLFTAKECREELARYKGKSKHFKRMNEPLIGLNRIFAEINAKRIRCNFWIGRILLSVKKRAFRKNN